jgi:hypothetical protein
VPDNDSDSLKCQKKGKNTNNNSVFVPLADKKKTERESDNASCARNFLEKLVESRHVSREIFIEIVIFRPSNLISCTSRL